MSKQCLNGNRVSVDVTVTRDVVVCIVVAKNETSKAQIGLGNLGATSLVVLLPV